MAINQFPQPTGGGGTVTSVTATSPVASTGGTTPVISMPVATTSVSGYLTSTDWNTFNNKTSNTGTVTSVAMTVPTGLSIAGTPITSSGTLDITYTTGYAIPTTASQTNWDSAYTQRLQWDGGSTNLVAATGRTSLGATTVGGNFFTLTNPAAITFPRMNADNTVSALGAATFRTAIGAGTVTSVAALTLGTTGTDLSSTVATGTTTAVITLQVPTASATNRGALSSTDWSTFNNKQAALGFTPVNKAGDTMTGALNLAAGTTSIAPLDFNTGVLLTTATAGAMEFDGIAPYFSVANSTRGAVATEQIIVLTSTNTLTSQTAVQPIFDGGGGSTNGSVTLPIGTYQFECSFALIGMSATSGSFGFALGGLATKTYTYNAQASKGTSLTTASAVTATYNTGAQTTLVTAGTGTVGTAFIKGIIRVTVSNVIIPQVSLTVASAAIIQAGSYFKISPMGDSTVSLVGNWS